jgi:hypothetical protein
MANSRGGEGWLLLGSFEESTAARPETQRHWNLSQDRERSRGLLAFPAHALLILEERLKEHQAQGLVCLSGDRERTYLALKILILAACRDSRDSRSAGQAGVRSSQRLQDEVRTED